jgi:hypothetical protein
MRWAKDVCAAGGKIGIATRQSAAQVPVRGYIRPELFHAVPENVKGKAGRLNGETIIG